MRLSFERVTRCLLYSNLGMELPIGERREHAEVIWREGDGGACRLVQRERDREKGCAAAVWVGMGQRAEEMRFWCCSSRRGTEEERVKCSHERETGERQRRSS